MFPLADLSSVDPVHRAAGFPTTRHKSSKCHCHVFSARTVTAGATHVGIFMTMSDLVLDECV